MSSKFYRVIKRSVKSLMATEYVRLELWCAFLDTFVYSWLTPIVVFFESCRRTFKWFPIIWKDRDWDYNHLFQIMQAKLRFMRERLTEHGNEVWKSRQRKIRQLKTCEALLDRMTKHEYNDKLMAQHREKWYKGMNFFERLNQPQNEEETKEFLKLMDYEEYMYQQDLELFCEMFKKYHKGWWD